MSHTTESVQSHHLPGCANNGRAMKFGRQVVLLCWPFLLHSQEKTKEKNEIFAPQEVNRHHNIICLVFYLDHSWQQTSNKVFSFLVCLLPIFRFSITSSSSNELTSSHPRRVNPERWLYWPVVTGPVFSHCYWQRAATTTTASRPLALAKRWVLQRQRRCWKPRVRSWRRVSN